MPIPASGIIGTFAGDDHLDDGKLFIYKRYAFSVIDGSFYRLRRGKERMDRRSQQLVARTVAMTKLTCVMVIMNTGELCI